LNIIISKLQGQEALRALFGTTLSATCVCRSATQDKMWVVQMVGLNLLLSGMYSSSLAHFGHLGGGESAGSCKSSS